MDSEISKLFNQFGHSSTVKKYEENQELFEIVKDKKEKIIVCIKKITGGGGGRSQDELRIQPKADSVNYVFDLQSKGEKSVLLGIYEKNDIICAWKIRHTSAKSTVSFQIKEETINIALSDGFSQQNKVGNEYCCAFRKEFLYFYLKNCEWIHDAKLEELNNHLTPEENKIQNIEMGKNKIFYGAPGTGKSHSVKKLVSGKEERTERVTFHPEFDYHSFVGGYKPSMELNADNKKNIVYKFIPQAFTKIYCDAWNYLAREKEEDFYLVIEEINRGNCAEIFGDIFQLLDRNSDYDISPSKELREFLENPEEGLVDKEFGLKGGKLKLPQNLTILATMNTSDQSLFPMDSAFKRRWNWEYIPIDYEESETNISSKFIVKLSELETFSWLDFIKKVNSIIKQNENLGMDKCLGNYFIMPEIENTIEVNLFINKVIFYLWNDVFKDEDEENNMFSKGTTYEDFFPIEPNGIRLLREVLERLEVKIEKVLQGLEETSGSVTQEEVEE